MSRSRAEIEGGSAINSKSGGGSFGTNCDSVTCLRSSCCFCATDDIERFLRPGNAVK